MKGIIIILVIIAVVLLVLRNFSKRMLKRLEEIRKEQEAKEKQFQAMSEKDRLNINDEALYNLVIGLIENKDIHYGEAGACFEYLNQAEQVIYVVYDYYESTFMYNSSLRDYFGSEKRDVCVARTSECLALVGAYDHQQVFDEFVRENNINLNDLSGFKSYWDDDYKKSKDGYSYNEVNARLRALPDIKTYMIKYIRANIASF